MVVSLLRINLTISENYSEAVDNANISSVTIDYATPLPWYIIVLVILMLTIPLLGTGNIAVLRFIFYSRENQTPINELVTAMLLANMIRCHGTVILELAEISSNYNFASRAYCSMRIFLQTYSLQFRVLLSVFLAVLRAYTCTKMVLMKLTKRQTRQVIVAAVVVTSLISAPNMMEGSPALKSCTLHFDGGHLISNIILLAKGVLFVLLFLTVACSYTILGLYIKVKKKTFYTGKKDLFTIQFGVLLSSVFVLCYFSPFIAFFVVPTPYEANPLTTAHLSHCFTFFTYIDTVIDPLLFVVQNKNFKTFIKSHRCFTSAALTEERVSLDNFCNNVDSANVINNTCKDTTGSEYI